MPTYSCGCVNATDPASGVLRSVSKCGFHLGHAREPAALGLDYYAEMGLFDSGQFQESSHKRELFDALGLFPSPQHPHAAALEVGCGTSPYASTLAREYDYHGIDPSAAAIGWMREHRVGRFDVTSLEDFRPGHRYALVLAAHVLEHVPDAPGAVRQLAGLLEPGGEFWAIVPDDQDPVNPDHLWYFTPETLRSVVESAGLDVLAMESRRVVEHEMFLYLRARRVS